MWTAGASGRAPVGDIEPLAPACTRFSPPSVPHATQAFLLPHQDPDTHARARLTNRDYSRPLNLGPDPVLAEQLQALPNLTKLRFHGDPWGCATSLSTPGGSQKLRELDLLLDDETDMSYRMYEKFCTLMESASGITALKWSCPSYLWLDMTFAVLALGRSPQLVSLEIAGRLRMADTGFGTSIQLTALQRLRLRRAVWPQVLPYLPSFPNLEDIGSILIEDEVVEKVSVLGRLSRLVVDGVKDFESVPTFSRLSTLRALSVINDYPHGHRHGLRSEVVELIRGVTQLTELAVSGEDLPLKGLSQMVAPMTRLKSLHLQGRPCTVSAFLEAPLHGLRHLSIALGGGSPSANSAAAGLLPHLCQLTRLSALRIEAPFDFHARVPASFLTSLTGLVDLKLRFVLCGNNAYADIRCLATLTRLEWLVVESVSQDRIPYQPSSCQRSPQRLPSRAVPVRVVFVNITDLQPLSALQMLEAWDLRDAWRWVGDNPNSVLEDLHAVKLPAGHEGLEDLRWRGSAFTHCMQYTP